MLDEEDSNKKLVERMKQEYITYGSVIQMVHIESESYLCAKKICAEVDKTCNKVELIDKPSQAIYFKIMPRYKYRTEGEKIKYGDQIIFLNLKVNLYLHVSETQIPIEVPLSLPLLPGTTKNEITPIIIDRRGPRK
jgi:Inositol 1,4,5-trisphosphate/ryanodine receptor